MHNIKNEKGITAIDIVLSVIIITVFTTLIGGLIIRININSKESERKSIAMSYATQEIEKIRAEKSIDDYINKGISTEEIIENVDIYKDNIYTGFHKRVYIKDYVLVKKDTSKIPNLLKEVTVEISYKINGKTESVQLSTYITKE